LYTFYKIKKKNNYDLNKKCFSIKYEYPLNIIFEQYNNFDFSKSINKKQLKIWNKLEI